MVQALWKQFGKMLNIELPYDLENPFLGIYPRELKVDIYTKTCMEMLIAVLFSQRVETTQKVHQLMDG